MSIAGPFKTSFGWHVVYVIAESPAKNISYSEAKLTITNEYLPSAQSTAAKKRLDGLIKKGNVVIVKEELDSLKRTQ